MKRGQTSRGNPPSRRSLLRTRRPSPIPSGFTLVEILTALAVLMIALSSIIGLLYGSFQHGRAAADRSAATILIPEAIRNISLEHMVYDNNAGWAYVETVAPSGTTTGRLFDETYELHAAHVRSYKAFEETSEATHAPGVGLSFYPSHDKSSIAMAGSYFRFRYRIEKKTDVDYNGLYSLTVVCYRDGERNASRLVQLSDPVTVYLRERK